jgi:hypothetical protein
MPVLSANSALAALALTPPDAGLARAAAEARATRAATGS